MTEPSDEELETIFYHGAGVTGTEAGGLRAVFEAGLAAGRVSVPPTEQELIVTVHEALEPYLESHIHLDLNDLSQSVAFAGIVDAVADAVLALITRSDND